MNTRQASEFAKVSGLTEAKSHRTMPWFSMRRLWIASKGETTYPGEDDPEPPPVIKVPFCKKSGQHFN
jgi:hypothetical protein